MWGCAIPIAMARRCRTCISRWRRAVSISSPERAARARRRCSNCSISRSAPARERSGCSAKTPARYRLPGFRRRIGVVFQDFRLVPHLSAFDNIALPLRLSGVPESDVDAPVREMLAWVGLAERGHATPPTLSGGEQQRIALARAVIGRPELLVADEPTGNVAPDMAARLLHLFESLNRLGTPVVVATHDFHLLNRIQNAHMLRLEAGRLMAPTGALRSPPSRPVQ